MIFHVLNRANNRNTIFEKDEDYFAFLCTLRDTLRKKPMRVVAYCIMPNHWHLVLWPEHDGDLGAFMQTLTTTHVRRWHLHRDSVGRGHLYQGTYKSFPVESDRHFYTVCRYAERNPLRAGLVRRAEDWRWSSLWQRQLGSCYREHPPLCDWPLPYPHGWTELVNRIETEAELAAIRHSIARGRPFGSDQWQVQTAQQLGLESTLRQRGRPRKRG